MTDDLFSHVTPAEWAVLFCLTDGDSNAAIATRLSISVNTVKNHFTSIFDKLGVDSRLQLLARHGDEIKLRRSSTKVSDMAAG
jgi:DNA-binding NarL/FixJ family response regulator